MRREQLRQTPLFFFLFEPRFRTHTTHNTHETKTLSKVVRSRSAHDCQYHHQPLTTMTIVYALVSRQKTVLAEYTTTSGESKPFVDWEGHYLFSPRSSVCSHALIFFHSNWKLSYSHASSLGKDTSQ
jgi:hypothetical protein